MIIERIILVLTLAFALQGKTWAQGSIGTGNTPSPPDQSFGFNFVVISSSPEESLPAGNADFYFQPRLVLFPPPAIGITSDALNVNLILGSVAATEVWIVQMGSNDSLIPIAQITNQEPIGGPPPLFHFTIIAIKLFNLQLTKSRVYLPANYMLKWISQMVVI